MKYIEILLISQCLTGVSWPNWRGIVVNLGENAMIGRGYFWRDWGKHASFGATTKLKQASQRCVF
ncbi:MAG: hypothetical protein K9G43_03940 [Rhodobacteraceae bacterium]|nr:hypothetical protein [Paracoccaceae bacterium]